MTMIHIQAETSPQPGARSPSWAQTRRAPATGSPPRQARPGSRALPSVCRSLQYLSSIFKPFVFGSNIQSITPITKSPVGKDLLPQERKHQMWSMAIDNVLDEDTRKTLESWSVEVGHQERRKTEELIKNTFDQSVEKKDTLTV